MKNLICLLILILPNYLIAQNKIIAGLGPSTHTGGDLQGYLVEAGISIKSDNKISYNFILKTTSTGHENPLYFTDPEGNKANSSYRVVDSGTQLEASPVLNLFRENKVGMSISVGGLVRYTTSNTYNQLAFLYPGATGYPIPLVAIEIDNIPFKTFSVGYVARVGATSKISPRSQLSVNFSLQNDNEGNQMWNLPLGYTYTLK